MKYLQPYCKYTPRYSHHDFMIINVVKSCHVGGGGGGGGEGLIDLMLKIKDISHLIGLNKGQTCVGGTWSLIVSGDH